MSDVLTSSEFLLTALSLFVSTTAILFALVIYVRKNSERNARERYDFQKHLVELEYMRKNLEMQLFDVSKKLEENEERWKDINHLIITSQNKQSDANLIDSDVRPNNFLKNLGITRPNEFEVDNKLVFVLTPFNDNYRPTFFVIKTICNKFGLKCLRGDEEYIPNEIFPTILRQIVKSRFIIANITGRNPNVMYELGVAHALGKPTIIISRNFTDIPFDLNNKRIIIFDSDSDLEQKLEISIKDLLVNKII